MIAIIQSKLHIPGKQNGNCIAAALASLLEVGLDDVPKFEEMGENRWWIELRKWLKIQGFHLMSWEIETGKEFYLPGYFIACGPSPRGFEHAVIYKNTEMVHDPHPSRDGLVKMTSVWALLPLDPARFDSECNLY